MAGGAAAEAFVLDARLAHIKGMLGVLQTVKQTKKQMATLLVDQHGLEVYTYDDSRVMQACARFKAEVFTEYAFRGADGALRQCFSTSLSNLVDSLAVCAASDGHADLTLRWPDHDGRLLLQLNAVRDVDDDGATVDSCIYAEISCEASNLAEDLEGEMTQPRSQFTLPCSTLRELVDDLDWAGAPVRISMRAEPAALSFAAHGPVVGDLKVEVDTGRAASTLHSFDCAGAQMSACYKFKFLRAATCMPPALMGASDGDSVGLSRVAMDAQGLLKVHHLLHIAKPPASSAAHGGSHAHGGGVRFFPGSGTADSLAEPPGSYPGSFAGGGSSAHGGGGGGGSLVVPVTFVLFPEDVPTDEGAAPDGDVAAGGGSERAAASRASPEL